MSCFLAETFARASFRSVAVLLGATLAGCTMEVVSNPDTFKVEPTRLSHLRQPQAVALKNMYASETKAQVRIHPHDFVFELKQLTDTAIVMLARSMDKHGIGVSEQAEKVVTLRVRVLGMRVRAIPPYSETVIGMQLDARFGDGMNTSVRADGNSPLGGERAASAAVLFALYKLLTDEKFVAYMNR